MLTRENKPAPNRPPTEERRTISSTDPFTGALVGSPVKKKGAGHGRQGGAGQQGGEHQFFS